MEIAMQVLFETLDPQGHQFRLGSTLAGAGVRLG
jgi:hypothetical protein